MKLYIPNFEFNYQSYLNLISLSFDLYLANNYYFNVKSQLITPQYYCLNLYLHISKFELIIKLPLGTSRDEAI